MRLFSHRSELCLLTLLLMLVYVVAGQGDKQESILKKSLAGRNGNLVKCGIRPLDNSGFRNLNRSGRSAAGIPESLGAADDQNVGRSVDSYSLERIVGGNDAKPGEFPWQGRIDLLVWGTDGRLKWKHNCGAVVISEYWLLTAAHCVKYYDKSSFRITVGDRSIRAHDNGEEQFTIQEIISHEQYKNDGIWDYDIALIKIKQKYGRGIQFSNYVQPVCLPDRETQFQVDSKCLASGWGSIAKRWFEEGPYVNPDILRGTELPLIDQVQCRFSWAAGHITNNMLCAGPMRGETGICQGDSGGPLVCKVQNVYTLCGISSKTRGCALENLPGVFANVATLLPWVQNKINIRSANAAERFIPVKP